jgi:hypothetical protein
MAGFQGRRGDQFRISAVITWFSGLNLGAPKPRALQMLRETRTLRRNKGFSRPPASPRLKLI